MRIAVVYQYYQGPEEPGHSVIYDLTRFMADRGHDVQVIAGETGYMKRSRPARSWVRRLVRTERDGGVRITRTYCYPELHRNYPTRLISFLSFTLSSAACLLLTVRPQTLLASSPPIFPVFAAGVVCRLRGIPFVFEVRDLWPASAVEMGILRNQWMIRVMAWMERWLYDRCDHIVALTNGIRDHIRLRGWEGSKIAFIPCGIDPSTMFPDPESRMRKRQQLGWEGKKIVLYFGAMGAANNLGVILDAARRLEDRRDILFALVGDGMQRNALLERCRTMGLRNVHFLPAVPKQEARACINAADLCVVTLKDIPLFRGAIPTKLLEYMACGKPVICGVSGEAATLVRQSQAGEVFRPDDDSGLAALVSGMLADEARTRAMSANGPGFVRRHFSAGEMQRRMESVLLASARA